jgi:CBS domain-containing protein
MYVREIIESKGARVFTIRPEAPIADAVRILQDANIGALIVSRDAKRLDGLIDERDIVAGLACDGGEVFERQVKDLMKREVATCGPDDSVRDLMSTMTWRRTRHVPVVESGVLCGIVSIGDLVKARLEELESETNVMRDLLSGARAM